MRKACALILSIQMCMGLGLRARVFCVGSVYPVSTATHLRRHVVNDDDGKAGGVDLQPSTGKQKSWLFVMETITLRQGLVQRHAG